MKGSFNVRIDPKLNQKAAIASSKLGISLNQFVKRAIESSLEESPNTIKNKEV